MTDDEMLAKSKGNFAPHAKDENDMGNLEDESEEEETEEEEETTIEDESESEEDTEDDSEEDEEDSEDEEEEEENSDSKNRKLVPKKFLDKEKAKRDKWKQKAQDAEAELARVKQEKSDIEAKLPDDLDAYADELAGKIGVEDPESLKEVLKVMKKVVGKDNEALTAKITELQTQLKDMTKVDADKNEQESFNTEWTSFEGIFKKEFPQATEEQVKKARKLMNDLSHTPDIGGVTFTDKDGVEKIKGYPFKFIFSENKESFEELVGSPKRKGIESGRSQGTTKNDEMDKPIKLTHKSSAADIRKRDRQLAAIESGESEDGLSTAEHNEI